MLWVSKPWRVFFVLLCVSIGLATHAQQIPASGCDPQIDNRLQSAQNWAYGKNLDQVTKTYNSLPASVGSLSCLKDLTAIFTMRTAFPSLANFTLTGNLADVLRRVVDRMVDKVEQQICDKVAGFLTQLQQDLTDLQQRVLGGQIPGALGIQPNNVPFRIAPRPNYTSQPAPVAPDIWNKVRSALGI